MKKATGLGLATFVFGVGTPFAGAAPAGPAPLIVDFEVVQLDLPVGATAPLAVPVTLDGTAHVLELRPHDLRGAGFVVLVPGGDGGLVPTETPAPRTMRGGVAGRPGSRVAASLHDGRLEALIDLGPAAPSWSIRPLDVFESGAPAGAHAVYRSDTASAPDFRCGNVELDDRHVHADAPAAPAAGGQTTDIAIDADFEYFVANGSSVEETVADVESVMNAVDAIYQAEVGICFNITLIVVRDDEPDPYDGSSHTAVLGQFRSEWNGNQREHRTDTMHLFTGRILGGGILGVANCIGCVCDLNRSYALSRARYSSLLYFRAGLVAHEIGHVYGAFHCNGGSCSGCNDCRIMCACQGSCCRDLEAFGASSTNSIIAHRNSRTCLDEGCAAPCPGDVDGNRTVDFADLLLVLGAWGPCGACPEDVDGNGVVEFADILDLLASWGPCA